MATFLDFLQSQKNAFVSEAFNENDIEHALKLINDVLKKHITKTFVAMPGMTTNKIGSDTCFSKQYLVKGTTPGTDTVFEFNWIASGSSIQVYSIDFFNNTDILWNGKAKSALSIYTMGQSVVYFLPIVWTVINSGNYNISKEDAVKMGKKEFGNSSLTESKYYVGALEYCVYDNLSENVIKDTFKLIAEKDYGEDDDVKKLRNQKKAAAELTSQHRDESPEAAAANKKAWDEYKAIMAAIKGGATTMDKLKLALKHNVSIVSEIDDTIKKAEEELKKDKEDPEVVFKKMNMYIKMVIKGLNPSVIICGAPGVGKSYRTMSLLKANGFREGHNMCLIKGRMSPRTLYTTMYEYKNKGQILVIDDADSLVGPHAPEDCINILKGALDSTTNDEGRKINYGVAGRLVDDEGLPIPKSFYYNGSVIILTNWNAGNLDTALRGRSYIQDINFTTEDMLNIIKKLMPGIAPNKLSAKSKIKAYDYLLKLADNNPEGFDISIRTFGICAQLYEVAADDPDLSDDEVESMIKEQMKLQSARKGKKY